MPFYPVNINIENRLCLIVGGGEVAARKIKSILFCKARVRVISPHVCKKISRFARDGKLEWLQREYERGDLRDAYLVMAATDRKEIQHLIVAEANDRKILINVVDDPAACTFQVPATVRRGEFLLAVSTGGSSPALSARIKKSIEAEYGPEYGLYVDLLSKVRETIVRDGGTQKSHKILFEKILQLNILTHIREENWPEVQRVLAEVLSEHVDVERIIEDVEITRKHE